MGKNLNMNYVNCALLVVVLVLVIFYSKKENFEGSRFDKKKCRESIKNAYKNINEIGGQTSEKECGNWGIVPEDPKQNWSMYKGPKKACYKSAGREPIEICKKWLTGNDDELKWHLNEDNLTNCRDSINDAYTSGKPSAKECGNWGEFPGEEWRTLEDQIQWSDPSENPPRSCYKGPGNTNPINKCKKWLTGVVPSRYPQFPAEKIMTARDAEAEANEVEEDQDAPTFAPVLLPPGHLNDSFLKCYNDDDCGGLRANFKTLPPTNLAKHLLSNIFRVKMPKTLQTQLDMSKDCADENKNCEKWAEEGECQKNPAYMSSSCRRSCKTCEDEITQDYGYLKY